MEANNPASLLALSEISLQCVNAISDQGLVFRIGLGYTLVELCSTVEPCTGEALRDVPNTFSKTLLYLYVTEYQF